jgi:hypothetical protein
MWELFLPHPIESMATEGLTVADIFLVINYSGSRSMYSQNDFMFHT